MVRLTVTDKQSGQRLDRFLKKYFDAAPLSHVYRLIRKDVKVNGKRQPAETMVQAGDEICIYISEMDAAAMQKQVAATAPGRPRTQARRQFGIAYEDENILIAEKPAGLLTHGDRTEKKRHLANQVVDYLIETGAYDPRTERTFTPAPVGRLDRNTTGLVMFGKSGPAMQALNRLLREKSETVQDAGPGGSRAVEPDSTDSRVRTYAQAESQTPGPAQAPAPALTLTKRYLTIAAGKVTGPLILKDWMVKDGERNQVTVAPDSLAGGKVMETRAVPLITARYQDRWYSLLAVEIATGRTHQIRAQLAKAGFPLIGDTKYGDRRVNEQMKKAFSLTTHLLHCWQLFFGGTPAAGTPLAYMAGRTVEAPLPPQFRRIKETLFGKNDSILESTKWKT